MAYLLYRDHTIVSSAVHENLSGNWKLAACISWEARRKDRIHYLKNSPEAFSRFDDAEAAGIQYSKKWIDNKLSSAVA